MSLYPFGRAPGEKGAPGTPSARQKSECYFSDNSTAGDPVWVKPYDDGIVIVNA